MTMTTTWLDDLSTLIVEGGFGTEGVDLYLGTMPDADRVAGSCMSLEPYQGIEGRDAYGPMGESIPVNAYPRCQAYFRDDSYEFLAPFGRAMSVFEYLTTLNPIVVGNTFFRDIHCSTPGKLGGQDSTGRYTISMRIELDIGR